MTPDSVCSTEANPRIAWLVFALASVCLITKRKALWGVSSLLGAMGIGYLVFGLFFV